MIFNVEETTLLRAFDTSTRRTAILSIMNEMGMMEDMELITQCMSMVKKLENVTGEDFAAVDFTVYDSEGDGQNDEPDTDPFPAVTSKRKEADHE